SNGRSRAMPRTLRPWRARACTRAQGAKGSTRSPPDDDVGRTTSSPILIPPRLGGVGDFSMFDLVHFYMIADTVQRPNTTAWVSKSCTLARKRTVSYTARIRPRLR